MNSLTLAAITRINPSHGPDESTFITLWNHGLETAEIARCSGIKVTMAQSRAYRLQQRGLIQSRPRGGGYPRPRAIARQEVGPPIIHQTIVHPRR